VDVADVPASEQARKLVLDLQVQEKKKTGEWGKPRAQTVSASNPTGLSDPLDRQLPTLLGGAERWDTYGFNVYGYGPARFRVAGPLFDAVLPALAGTGRVRLRRDPTIRTETTSIPIFESIASAATG